MAEREKSREGQMPRWGSWAYSSLCWSSKAERKAGYSRAGGRKMGGSARRASSHSGSLGGWAGSRSAGPIRLPSARPIGLQGRREGRPSCLPTELQGQPVPGPRGEKRVGRIGEEGEEGAGRREGRWMRRSVRIGGRSGLTQVPGAGHQPCCCSHCRLRTSGARTRARARLSGRGLRASGGRRGGRGERAGSGRHGRGQRIERRDRRRVERKKGNEGGRRSSGRWAGSGAGAGVGRRSFWSSLWLWLWMAGRPGEAAGLPWAGRVGG